MVASLEILHGPSHMEVRFRRMHITLCNSYTHNARTHRLRTTTAGPLPRPPPTPFPSTVFSPVPFSSPQKKSHLLYSQPMHFAAPLPLLPAQSNDVDSNTNQCDSFLPSPLHTHTQTHTSSYIGDVQRCDGTVSCGGR